MKAGAEASIYPVAVTWCILLKEAGESGPGIARWIARIQHEVGMWMYAAGMQPGQGTYKYSSR